MATTIKEERERKLRWVTQEFENKSAKLAGTVQEGLYQLDLVSGSTDDDEEFGRTLQLYADSVIDRLNRLNEVIKETLADYGCEVDE